MKQHWKMFHNKYDSEKTIKKNRHIEENTTSSNETKGNLVHSSSRQSSKNSRDRTRKNAHLITTEILPTDDPT